MKDILIKPIVFEKASTFFLKTISEALQTIALQLLFIILKLYRFLWYLFNKTAISYSILNLQFLYAFLRSKNNLNNYSELIEFLGTDNKDNK